MHLEIPRAPTLEQLASKECSLEAGSTEVYDGTA